MRDKLEEAVRMQLVSDVPVGVFLSGGIDSSTTAAIATRVLERRLPSFTIGFDDAASDERDFARVTSQFLRTLPHEEVLDAGGRAAPDPRRSSLSTTSRSSTTRACRRSPYRGSRAATACP